MTQIIEIYYGVNPIKNRCQKLYDNSGVTDNNSIHGFLYNKM